MIRPAILGGLFIGILSALPVVSFLNCCCLWVMAGGVLAAYIDQQSYALPTTVGRGASVGALAGIIGAFVWIPVAMILSTILAPFQERIVAEIVRSTPDMPPEARAWLEGFAGPGSSAFRYAMGFAFQFCAGAIFGTLGGVIGAAFFRTNVPPALGGPMPPPPPPTDRW